MSALAQAGLYWTLSLATLAWGGWSVCGQGRCAPTDLDRLGLNLADALRSGPLDLVMGMVTWLGSLAVLFPLALALAGFLLRARRRRAAGFIMLALVGASALGHLVKFWVARPRPDLFPTGLPMPEDWSYPSAHAMQVTAMALALFLAGGHGRVTWAMPLVLTVLLVGVSRIYLQVHFPSDVLAGTLAAVCWVGGLYVLLGLPAAGRMGGEQRSGGGV